MSIGRRLRTSVGLMYGVLGSTVPKPVPLLMAIGKAVPVGPAMRRTDPGFDEQVLVGWGWGRGGQGLEEGA